MAHTTWDFLRAVSVHFGHCLVLIMISLFNFSLINKIVFTNEQTFTNVFPYADAIILTPNLTVDVA